MKKPFLFALLTFAAPAQALPGAWLQEAGHAQVITTLSAYQSDSYWDVAGQKRQNGDYQKLELAPYVEYGFSDKITIGGTAFLQQVRTQAGSAQGLAEAETFVRAKLFDVNNGVITIQPFVKLPGSENKRTPALGSRQTDTGVNVLWGQNHSLLGFPIFSELEAGYRYRFGRAENQWRTNASVGIEATPSLTLIAQNFTTISTNNSGMVGNFTQSSNDDYDLAKLQLSALYTINESYRLQIGAFKDVYGRNTGSGEGALVAVWRHF